MPTRASTRSSGAAEREARMDDHIYKIIELAGSSATSIEDAIQNAISRASQSVHGLRWFEVIETRGHIDNGRVAHYQVVIKVGFTVEDRADA
jgi:flavin-binding protein dodecin